MDSSSPLCHSLTCFPDFFPPARDHRPPAIAASLSAAAEGFFQTDRHFRRDPARPLTRLFMAAASRERFRAISHRTPQRLQTVIPNRQSRMGRAFHTHRHYAGGADWEQILFSTPTKLLVLASGWGLIDLPLRASNEGLLRPRVARAQKIIRLHPPLFLLEQEGSSAAPFLLRKPRVARAQETI